MGRGPHGDASETPVAHNGFPIASHLQDIDASRRPYFGGFRHGPQQANRVLADAACPAVVDHAGVKGYMHRGLRIWDSGLDVSNSR
jgi:hypothetical protein